MSDDFLSRWSRLKRRSTAGPERPTADAVPAKAGTSLEAPVAGSALAPGLRRGDEPVERRGDEPGERRGDEPAESSNPLPPIESLTPDSDFSPFMKPEVDASLKRQALKTLFQDPRFNVMDGLDVYIADYSVADPLPEGWLEKMTQVARLGEYQAPEEEASNPEAEAAAALDKPPRNEALATPPEPAPSDTPEAAAMPPQVSQSPSRE